MTRQILLPSLEEFLALLTHRSLTLPPHLLTPTKAEDASTPQVCTPLLAEPDPSCTQVMRCVNSMLQVSNCIVLYHPEIRIHCDALTDARAVSRAGHSKAGIC